MSAKQGVQFGLWSSFRNPAQWQTDYADLYDAHLRQIAWAKTIGYHHVLRPSRPT